MIGWISYIRICHKISSFENDWLNILIICHWISPFKNGCLDILIWEIVKGNSNVCRCYCSSLEPPDQTCLGFRILTTRCEECQNKRVFSLYNWISVVQYQPFSANLWTKCGTFIWERSVASIIFAGIEPNFCKIKKKRQAHLVLRPWFQELLLVDHLKMQRAEFL